MDTEAWWVAYFDGSLNWEHTFRVDEVISIGVLASGTDRKFFVELNGGRHILGGTSGLAWSTVLDLARALPDSGHRIVALLQRFTWNSVAEFADLVERLREAHRAIGAVANPTAFVARTVVTTNSKTIAPPVIDELVTAIAGATPLLRFETEYELGRMALLRARELPTGDAARKPHLQESVRHFFAASGEDVPAKDRADALAYSAAMLVELAEFLSDSEAVVTLEQAAHRFELVTRIDSNNVDGRRRAADALHQMADRFCDAEPERAAKLYAQAARHAREAVASTPESEHAETLDVLIAVEVMIDDCLKRCGRPVEASEALGRALEACARVPPSMNTACAYAAAGRWDDALAALEVGAPAKALTADELREDEFFFALHEHPRFVALLATL